jgi:hypothetical protein
MMCHFHYTFVVVGIVVVIMPQNYITLLNGTCHDHMEMTQVVDDEELETKVSS